MMVAYTMKTGLTLINLMIIKVRTKGLLTSQEAKHLRKRMQFINQRIFLFI